MEFAREFVENLLFVAVSGLLFLIVVVGDGSDAMESRNILQARQVQERQVQACEKSAPAMVGAMTGARR